MPVNSSSKMWDLKTDDFPRFSNELTPFQQEVFSLMKEFGVDFDGKTILDIGCGTGVYTLHLAKKSKKVYALDFSQKMLDTLTEDGKRFNILNIEQICCDFKTYDGEGVDFVFCSMSPALLEKEDFKKAFSFAKNGFIYLGWGGKRESIVMEKIFNAHGEKLHAPPGANRLKEWLVLKGFEFKNRYLETLWEKKSKLEDAIRFEGWHLKMHGIEPNEKKLRAVLKEFVNEDGDILTTTKVGLELIVWVR
ncbi:MAG: class I SAM-dependent methyltransferase [Campylobacterales bacterium]|nr:class I SAM-dependent methyltransferase [Campylobacterales bacterium]